MIKTHKPRGHIWTHASDFQQTKEFRDIRYEECIATTCKEVDKPDPDSHRYKKRRRIEKLADDFLNGVPLFIASARPCPQASKTAVVRSQRPSSGPKFVWPNVEPVKHFTGEDSVWVDHESEAETLERLRQRGKSALTREATREKSHDDHSASHCVIEAVEAQASCGRVRRSKPINISTDASADALRQAAALRARRLQRANSGLPVVPDSLSLGYGRAEINAEPRSDPGYEVAEMARRTSKWLSRRKSRFKFVDDDELEDSIDELQRSAMKTTSRSDVPDRPLREEPVPAIREHSTESYHDLDRSQVPDEPIDSNGRSPEQGSYHTAQEETEANPDHGNVQDTRIEGPAVVIYVSGQTMSTKPKPTGDTTAEVRRPRSAGNATPQQLSSSKTRSAALRQMQNSVNVNSSEDQLYLAHATRSAPKRLAYTAAEVSQNGRSPFPYRKGRLRSRETSMESETAHVQVTGRRSFHTSNLREEPVEASASRSTDRLVAGAAPMLDMSFEHDSSFAPKLTMALVDEHLNSVLPSRTASERKNSAVKKAIRRELRNSGAEISRCGSEPPTSSLVGRDDVNVDQREGESEEVQQPLVDSVQAQLLPDTQFMLRKAHKDLFESPEKQVDTKSSVPMATSTSTSSPKSKAGDVTREPLKQLSQEPLPSTQQILGDFEGWSTVKKPRTARRSSHDDTPTASKQSAWTSISSTKETPAATEASSRKITVDRRRSSLRYPIASALLDANTALEESPAATHSSRSRPSNTSTDMRTLVSNPKPSSSSQQETYPPGNTLRPLPSAQTTNSLETSQSFTSAPQMSSYQAAQVVQSGLVRDTSNLSETVEDLTRELLDVGELGGVFSQVG